MNMTLSPLDQSLLSWSCDHWPEPLDAIMDHFADEAYVRKCLGSISRRRAAEDAGWLWRTLSDDPGAVLALSPAIRQVTLGTLTFPPQGMNWREWIEAVRRCDEFTPSGDMGWGDSDESNENGDLKNDDVSASHKASKSSKTGKAANGGLF